MRKIKEADQAAGANRANKTESVARVTLEGLVRVGEPPSSSKGTVGADDPGTAKFAASTFENVSGAFKKA